MYWNDLIRQVRETCGLKQEAAAQLFGVSQATLSRWERGESTPSVAIRARIIDVANKEQERMALSGTVAPKALVDVARACTAIHAASTGDLATLKKSALAGATIDCADYDNRTPLHLAAAEGHADVVAYLLEQGAAPNVKDRWGATPSDSAIRHKHWPVVELLATARAGTPSSEIETDKEKGLAVILAASAGDLDTIKYTALAGGALNVADYDGRTPLHLAAAEGHADVVAFLLEHGVHPSPVDRWGATPADGAIANRHWPIVEMLAKAKAKAKPPPAEARAQTNVLKTLTAIQAASVGDLETLSHMALAGASLDCADYDGRTPLHLAAAEGHADVVDFLLERGVRADAVDRWGETPAESAAQNGHHAIAKQLRASARSSSPRPLDPPPHPLR